MPEKILITGAAGFVSHHLIDYVLRHTDWNIVALDRFSRTPHGFERLHEIGAMANERVTVYVANLSGAVETALARDIPEANYIVHLAAATRIESSIARPREFVHANILGTLELLEYARQVKGLKAFLYFSTDEVFGPAPDGAKFREWHRYSSVNPYAATKAAAEELCLAWASTYGIPVVITHSQNLIGERQASEKFLPSVVRSALAGSSVNVYADPITTKPASRDFLHARDAASAVIFLLKHGLPRSKYNISANRPVSCIELISKVGEVLDTKILFELLSAESVRPGFSVRYGLCGDKLLQMGWKPPKTFEENMKETVSWMVTPENRKWLDL